MREFDLVYRDIKLRVICDSYIENIVKDHFANHLEFREPNGSPTYTLIVTENALKIGGQYYKMVDKWFDNATLDCYIDNTNKTCYATNFVASTNEYKNLLIQYFIANVFNRFLEIKGYFGVHSSCVEKENKGVLFVAGRFSGKTNCMLNLMHEGYNSVTNDKIALNKIGEDIVGYGIAQSISIRLGKTFCSRPQNEKYVKIAKARGIEIKNESMLEGNNLVLSDNELASINNVKQVFDSSISCVISPSYDPDIKKPIFSELKKEQKIELFNANYMSLVHETTDFLSNISLNGVSNIDRRKLINELTNLRCYYCRQNENTTEEFVEIVRKLIK